MFDYSIGHYQKHPPTKRQFMSWAMSCLAHACAVLVMVEYPQLLEGGMNLWFRQPAYGSPPAQTKQWRSVALLGSTMQMPPLEVLKKFAYDWNRKPAKQEDTLSIRVNIPVTTTEVPALPKPRPEAPVALNTSPAIAPAIATSSTPPVVPQSDATRVEVPSEAKKPTPPPVSPPNVAPSEIPKGVTATSTGSSGSAPPSNSGSTSASQARSQNRISQEQQSGIRVEGGATFDAKGFPLEQYINVIKELAKGNWEIPSNLRNSQGSTTILFYIDKKGNSSGAIIDVSSGNTSLDLSALSAVLKSNPFPPLPVGFPADRVGVRFVFAYNERK